MEYSGNIPPPYSTENTASMDWITKREDVNALKTSKKEIEIKLWHDIIKTHSGIYEHHSE